MFCIISVWTRLSASPSHWQKLPAHFANRAILHTGGSLLNICSVSFLRPVVTDWGLCVTMDAQSWRNSWLPDNTHTHTYTHKHIHTHTHKHTHARATVFTCQHQADSHSVHFERPPSPAKPIYTSRVKT